MRLPTVSQFKSQMSTLSRQFEDIGRLQEQTTTGKKLRRSSENPMLADKIKSVTNAMQTTKSYDLNNTVATSRLSLTSSTTQQSINLLDQIKDLILSAQSDTLSNENRASIAQELKGYADTLLGMANTQDNNGEYIFSGMSSHIPPWVKEAGLYRYMGESEITRIDLESHTSVPFNDSGFRVFGDIKSGNGYFSVSADTANNTGSGILSSVKQVNTAAMVHDDYTVTFVTNAAGELAYQLVGASSGQLIPALPATSPADAPAYEAGHDIIFNGISMQINGAPDVGDEFYIDQSKTQNVFDALDAVIDILSKPVNTPKDRADLHQILGENSSSLNQAFNHLLQYSTEVGNRGKTVDEMKIMAEMRTLEQEKMMDRFSNAPMEEVVSDLTQRMTALELTQQSYLKIQETLHKLFMNFR